MERILWKERIEISPDIHGGEPCIKGTRIPVKMIIGSLADGMSEEDVLRAYPTLTSQDIRATLAYAAESLHEEILVPLKV